MKQIFTTCCVSFFVIANTSFSMDDLNLEESKKLSFQQVASLERNNQGSIDIENSKQSNISINKIFPQESGMESNKASPSDEEQESLSPGKEKSKNKHPDLIDEIASQDNVISNHDCSEKCLRLSTLCCFHNWLCCETWRTVFHISAKVTLLALTSMSYSYSQSCSEAQSRTELLAVMFSGGVLATELWSLYAKNAFQKRALLYKKFFGKKERNICPQKNLRQNKQPCIKEDEKA